MIPSPESPKAPEPPVPVDLDDIMDAVETCEDLNQEYQNSINGSKQERDALENLTAARQAIGKAFEDLRIENKALRSRISEVEGEQARNEDWKVQHDAVVAKLALERQLQAHMRASVPPGTWDRILSTFPQPQHHGETK